MLACCHSLWPWAVVYLRVCFSQFFFSMSPVDHLKIVCFFYCFGRQSLLLPSTLLLFFFNFQNDQYCKTISYETGGDSSSAELPKWSKMAIWISYRCETVYLATRMILRKIHEWKLVYPVLCIIKISCFFNVSGGNFPSFYFNRRF